MTSYYITIDDFVGGVLTKRAGSVIQEGDYASFALHLKGYSRTTFPSGTVIPFTITGVSANDISLEGLVEKANGQFYGEIKVDTPFVILNETVAHIVIKTLADGITDGNKTLTLTVEDTSSSVIISDTSNANSIKEYGISISALFDPSSEGDTVIAYVTTNNVTDGTEIFYEISGSNITISDFENFALTGSLKINSAVGNQIKIPIYADGVTEGDETFTIQLFLDSQKTISVGKPHNVKILDTSKGIGNPTYTLTAIQLSTDEGKTADFTLSTIDVPSGSVIAYKLVGINSADIIGGSLIGSVTTNNQGTALISIAISADQLTEGSETLTLVIAGATASVVINDTSKSVPTYALTTSNSEVSEGSTAIFTLTTTNVAAGTYIPYVISGVSNEDISGGLLSGNALVNTSGLALISIGIAADQLTEGSETLTLSAGGTSASIVINDTSKANVITTESHNLSVLVDKGILGLAPVLLKGLSETITFTNGFVSKHIVQYSGIEFIYDQIDPLITTITRDGEFTAEFNKEINDYVQSDANITYKVAVALVGAQNIDNIIVMVAGSDGNYVS